MTIKPGAIRFCIILILQSATGLAQAANIIVDTTADDANVNGNCTLREAITSANNDVATDNCVAGSGPDNIYFAITGIIQLASDLPVIENSLSILGPGAEHLTISGEHPSPSIDAPFYRLLDLKNGQPPPVAGNVYFIRGLTLSSGNATDDLSQGRSGVGGGINIRGNSSVTLDHVKVQNSTANRGGGGVYIGVNTNVDILWSEISTNQSEGNPGGGGILVVGKSGLNITDSSVIGNTAQKPSGAGGRGGGIYIASLVPGNLGNSTITINRSTIVGNVAEYFTGGGIHAVAKAGESVSMSINNSTITDNIVGLNVNNGPTFGGGGVYMSSSNLAVTFKNNIIANNFDESVNPKQTDDLINAVSGPASITTNGYNYIGVNSGTGEFPNGSPNANADFVGTGDPSLQALAYYNGSPTRTRPPTLGIGNPVVDKGSCTGEPHDQNGRGHVSNNNRIVDRPDVNFSNHDDGCDIGAVETAIGTHGGGPVSDHDSDGIVDVNDNCLFDSNPSQTNTENDAFGDICDFDDDNDSVFDAADNCPLTANQNQTDTDNDTIGDACDDDDDNDGINDDLDNCPLAHNPDQTDLDNNGHGDVCEDCEFFILQNQSGSSVTICL